MDARWLPGFRPVLRALSIGGLLVGVSSAPLPAAQPTVEYALGLKPYQQDIDYDQPTGDEASGATIKMEKEGGVTAWVVRDARGQILRSFADTNGDRVVDRWSYYRDGQEVYRDIDANFNRRSTHCSY